jgi:hypothetical protein
MPYRKALHQLATKSSALRRVAAQEPASNEFRFSRTKEAKAGATARPALAVY